VLIHVCELRKEIELFLRHRGSGIAKHLENEFIMSLAYRLPCRYIQPPQRLNTSIQGTAMNMIKAREKITAFTNKLSSCICLI